MPPRLLRVLAGSGLLLVGFGVGWVARDHTRVSEAVANAARPAVSVTLPDSFWVEMETQRAMLRQLHETCESRPTAVLAAPQPLPKTPTEVAPSGSAAPEDPTVLPAAQALVDRAIANGKWTDDDAAALRQTMSEMSPAQRDKAMHILLRALNEQGL